MNDTLSLLVGERSEHHVQLTFLAAAAAGLAEITGVVRGPFSQFAKTLTADFPLRPTENTGGSIAMVTEPCYWSPRLPFWYDARLTCKLQNGDTREETFPIGFKRFYCEGKNFRLEGKRIVLRGLHCDYPSEEDLRRARRCETALVVQGGNDILYNEASRIGVPLVVDLRAVVAEEVLAEEHCDCYPAVMLVLASTGQLQDNSWTRPRESYLVASIAPSDPQPNVACDAFAIELNPGEWPPAWLATCDKPVIAIGKSSTSEIPTARGDCDRLQAELAPEFDLAGYFV